VCGGPKFLFLVVDVALQWVDLVLGIGFVPAMRLLWHCKVCDDVLIEVEAD